MREFLVRLENRRLALRERVLGKLHLDNDSYFGMALIVLGLTLAIPGGFIALPPFAVVVLLLGVLGLILLFTIIFAPLGLFLL